MMCQLKTAVPRGAPQLCTAASLCLFMEEDPMTSCLSSIAGRVSLENFITLEDVDYIPGLTANIVSVSKLAELDYEVIMGAECFVRDNTAGGALVGRGRRVNGVYVLDYLLVPPGRVAAAAPQEPAAN